MTRDEAHQWALHYARRSVEVCGVPVERLRRSWAETPHSGHGAPGEPGYVIAHGAMQVPSFRGHKFRTAEILEEYERSQGDLFREAV